MYYMEKKVLEKMGKYENEFKNTSVVYLNIYTNDLIIITPKQIILIPLFDSLFRDLYE